MPGQLDDSLLKSDIQRRKSRVIESTSLSSAFSKSMMSPPWSTPMCQGSLFHRLVVHGKLSTHEDALDPHSHAVPIIDFEPVSLFGFKSPLGANATKPEDFANAAESLRDALSSNKDLREANLGLFAHSHPHLSHDAIRVSPLPCQIA